MLQSDRCSGAWTVLLDETGKLKAADLEGEMKPTFVISRLAELIQLLQTEFDLQPTAAARDTTLVMQETAGQA